MRIIVFVTAIALLGASAALAQAQSGSGSGDQPQNKGSTGWTGAHPETGGATSDASPSQDKPKSASETTGQAVQIHDDALAQSQPFVATGEDLKGPAKQFPPSKTPE